MRTLLCSGQSNALDHVTQGDFVISPRVTIWNCASEVYDATTQLGNSFGAVNPASHPFLAGGHSMFVRLASVLAEELEEDIRLILVAHSGKSIDSWVTGPMTQRILAVCSAAGVSSVDGFAWHQGETSATDYPTKFAAMLTALNGLLGSAPVVVGELAAQHGAMNGILAGLGFPLARLSHLPTFDGNHFTGPSRNRGAVQFAQHFLEAWL